MMKQLNCNNCAKVFSSVLILISFVLSNHQVSGRAQEDFGYDGQRGPSHWQEQYKQCVGKHQSPINIDMHTVIKTKYPQLEFNNINIEHDTEIINNGHTVMLKIKGETNLPTVQGGPLRNTYQFVQLHFHWGDNDTFGSENRIDNRTFPLELHMVFYNTKYPNSSEAMEHSDGLTVLAFLYELSENNNTDYIDFVDSLNKIHDVDTSTPIAHKESIVELIRPVVDQGLVEYFTYEGSLTTPPCSEVVIWIEFSDYINLSHQQLDEFRQLSDHVGVMKHNFRPVQPINDRHVYLNCDYCDNLVDGNNNERGAATAIINHTNTIPIIILLVLLCLNRL